MSELTHIARFAEEHYPKLKDWPEGRLIAWLEWAASEGFLMVVHEGDKENLRGLIFAKPVKRPPKGHSYEFHRTGSYIYVDFAIFKDKQTLRNLAQAVLRNIGRRPKFAYHNTPGNRLRIRDTDTVLKALFNSH